MGIFSTNSRPGLANYTVEAAEGYGGPGAGYKIMVECHQNDMAMFNGLIQLDFNEAYAGINESSIITEGAIGNFFKKLKEFFLKLIEKIKGLVKSFMTKFVAMFVRDGKDLVKKYHKQIIKNLNDGKLKNMSFKAHENFLTANLIVESINTSTIYTETYSKAIGLLNRKDAKFVDDCQKMREELFDNDKALEERLGGPLADYKEDFFDKSIGTVDTFDEYTSSMNTTIEGMLTNGGKNLKALQALQKKAEIACKKNIDSVQKAENEFFKLEKGKTSSYKDTIDGTSRDSGVNTFTSEQGTALTGLLYQAALADQTYVTNVMTATIDAYKLQLKDCRSAYIKAASFRGVKEDALMDFIDEASNYEVDMIFESPCKSEASDEEIENTINQDVADIADEECK